MGPSPKASSLSVLLLFATAASPSAAADNFYPTRDFAARSGQSLSTMPQFVLLSIDGAITPGAYDLYRPLGKYRSPIDGCPLKATWYVNVAQAPGGTPGTKCDIVAGLRRSGHEIATRTYGQSKTPTKDQIIGAVDWLNETCGVPREEMRGFRTPLLAFDQSTFDNLANLSFTYDSSIADAELNSADGTNNLWPYTMDNGIAQSCMASGGTCNQTKSNPGLWEVPLWRMRDEDDTLLLAVDWFEEEKTVTETLTRNFDKKYSGNKAPFPISLSASNLVDNIGELTAWIDDTLSTYDDVFFVTTHELLEWMRNPVTATQYKSLREDDICVDLFTDCIIPSHEDGGCGHGKFDFDNCECACPHPWGGENCLTKISDFWTPAPTFVPTPAPSGTPSGVPSGKPSVPPTSSPSTSHEPTPWTWEPTRQPSSRPSSRPSGPPTALPTASPTEVPTASPAESQQGAQMAATRPAISPAAPFAAGGNTAVVVMTMCLTVVALLGAAVAM